MDTREVGERLGLVTFDSALPMDWYDEVHAKTGVWPQSLGFVWGYDDAKVWGMPVPLSSSALTLLTTLHWQEFVTGIGRLGHAALTEQLHPEYGVQDCRTCRAITKAEDWLMSGGIS